MLRAQDEPKKNPMKNQSRPRRKDTIPRFPKNALSKDMREYNNLILQCIPSGVMVINMDGLVTFCNASADSILGIDCTKEKDKSYLNILKGNSHVAQLIKNGVNGETYYRKQIQVKIDGSIKWIGITTSILYDDKATPIGVIAVFSDITDVKELEADIKLKERLAAVGELSAGVAHEIRNPLSAIAGYAELLKKGLSEDEIASAVDAIIKETKNLNRIVTNFLSFVKKPQPIFEETDVNTLIKEVISMVSLAKDADRIDFDIKALKTLPAVEADPFELRMAFLNIIQNAVQAMPNGGRLTVKSGIQYGRIFIEISDTGSGIPKEIGDRVFNPFFTTKEQGTGLGLAIVHKIIEAHDGKIEFKTRHGKGTTFIIRLPIRR